MPKKSRRPLGPTAVVSAGNSDAPKASGRASSARKSTTRNTTAASPVPRRRGANAAADQERGSQRPAIQDRGQRRIESILDAAEQVIAEVGYDAATTDAIAKLAGASTGSIYHFFPTKDAILGALATRYAERTSAINKHAMPIEFIWVPLDILFERVIEGQLQFSLNAPAFQAVHDAAMRVFGRMGPYAKLEGAIMAHVYDYLAARLPKMPERERQAAARVSVMSVHAALDLACGLPEGERDAIAREVKRMMVSYFTPLDARYGGRRPNDHAAGGTKRPSTMPP